MGEGPEDQEEVNMEDADDPGGWHGALRRLAKAMPPDLQREVDELLLLYALNGVSDASAANAVAEL